MVSLFVLGIGQAVAAGAVTATSLTVSSGGAGVLSGGSIASPAQLTLTATVQAGSTLVNKGTVNFCVSGAAICSDVNFIGTAQLTSAGTASFTFVPNIGVHSYVAVYAGTSLNSASTSTAYAVTVTGSYPTTSVLTSTLTSANPNVYTLTDTVTGNIQAYPSGTISFEDTANANYVLGTAPLVNGTSSFLLNAKPTVNTTTNYTRFVAVGDVNGDGIPDIVTSLFYGPPGPGVQVFTGRGDGTFNTGSVYTVSSQYGPQFISLADFNNDGCPDILAEAFNTNQMALYLNTKTAGGCTGIFAAPNYFSGPGGIYAINGPGGLAVGDFNQDGNLDFVVNNNGPSGNSGTNSIVFFGDGAGGFAAATPLQLAPGGTVVPQYTAVGDFNGDGFLDLAIANNGNDTFNVYLNTGAGGFTLAHTYSTPVGNGIIKAADFNLDGKLDLAIASGSTSVPITMWKGNGDGSFTQETNPAVGSISIASFSVADFNGDNKPDLIYNTSSANATGSIYVMLGNGDLTFQAPTTGVSTLGNDTLSLAVGDFNGDGYSDVVVGNYSSNNLGVYLSEYQQTATAALAGVTVSGASSNPHLVIAAFPANSPYAASPSNSVSLAANLLSDSLTLTDLTPPSTVYGQQATFQAVLSPYMSQGYTTNGQNVTFYDGANALGTAPLVSGVATFSTTTLAIGLHSLTATYTTDGNFAAATSSPSISHPVTSIPDTITVTSPASNPSSTTYRAGGTVAIAAGSTSGQPLTYTSTTPSVCSVSSTGVVSTLSTGICSITLSQSAAGSYAAATPQTVTINISGGTNTITFPPLANTVIGATPPVPAATATSGVTPTYTSSTTSVCTVTSAGVITDLTPGTCTITASQGATGNYAAATPVSQTYQVTALTDTITVNSPASPASTTYSPSGTLQIAASSTSGQPLTYASATPSVCSVSSSGVITTLSTGTCTVTINQPASGNYAAAPQQTVTVNVGAGTNTITFPALASTAIGATPPVPAATATSGVAPTYSSSTPSVCTVSPTGAITDLTPGLCTIIASQSATGNYGAATSVSQSYQVTPLSDAITVTSPASPANINYSNGGTLPIVASSTSGQPITYVSTTPAICSVSSSGVVTTLSTGTCAVTLSQSAAGNYAAASSQTVSINIAAGTNTISFPALANTAIGATAPVLAATSTAGGSITYASTTTSVCTVSGGVITDVAPGTCTITANQGATGNYSAAAQQVQSYQVTALADTITIPPSVPTTTPYVSGGTIPIGGTSTSGQPITYTSATPSVCTVTSPGGVITTTGTGVCMINATQPASGNYAAATAVPINITITAGTNTIAFPALPNTALGSSPPVPSATATSGVSPVYASSTPNVCTVTSTGVITDLAPGTCTITASQAATGNYGPANPVSQSYQVTALPDTITVSSPNSPATVAFGGAPISISASSTSGQPLTYSTSSPSCSVSSTGVVTVLSTGSCVVTVSQPSSGNYAAATPQTVTINIGAGTNTITFPALPNTPAGATAPTLAATSSAGGTIAYASITPTVCTVSNGVITDLAPGTCTITANQAATSNYAAASQQTQSYQVTLLTDTITVPPSVPTSTTVGSSLPIGATTTSGVPATYASATPLVCSVSPSGVITSLSTGTCSVTVSQAAAGNYAAASPQTVTILVNGQSQAIQNFGVGISAAYGGPTPVLAATATSNLTPTYTSSGAACSVTSSGIVTILAVGVCQITASQSGNSTYAPATPVSETLTVTAATDVITIPSTVPSATTAGTTFSVGATTSSGLPPTYTTSTPLICSVSSTGVVTTLEPGTCSINVTQPASGNYGAASPQAVNILVSGALDTITFPSLANTPFTSAPPLPLATASSGAPVTYSSASAACSISTLGVITFNSVGICSITASQPATGSYAAATPVTQSFTITPGANTITVPPTVPTSALPGSTVSVGATSTSGGPITYVSATPSVCSVTSPGGVITILAAGTCTVTLSQAASGNFGSAPSQVLTISTYDFTIVANTPTSQLVVPGNAVVYTYALAPLGGQYPGASVTYTVAGLPPGATYAFTPISGSVTQGAGPKTITLTITTAQAIATNSLQRRAPWTLALLLPFLLRRRVRRKLVRTINLLLLLTAITIAVSGCAAPNGFFGQPIGNYSITVTANSGGITHSAMPVSLEVQ